MRVLVTGGAGYIGGHVVRLLRARGHFVVVADDMSTGDPRRIEGVSLLRVDIADPDSLGSLASLLVHNAIDAVIHLAARKRVDESVARPAWYFRQNIGSLAVLLEAMQEARVDQLVFSSSAAVYGATDGAAIRETDAVEPINPYGASKLMGEQLIQAATKAFTLRAASLRYFNVAGSGAPELGDTAVLNLVPMVFAKLDAGDSPIVFGDDYPTADGSCVRDFVHVSDLAEAHLAALNHVASSEPGHVVMNVGTGVGSSVLQVVNEILAASGSSASVAVATRRQGDPAAVVADPSFIQELTGWCAQRTLADIVESAWISHRYFKAGVAGKLPPEAPGLVGR